MQTSVVKSNNFKVTETNPDCIKEYVEGWCRRDAAQVVQSFSDDGVFVDKPHPDIRKSDLTDFLDNVAWMNFPDMEFETLSVFGDGKTFAWVWVMLVGNPGFIKGSRGRQIAVPGVDVMRVKGDRIQLAVSYFDRKMLWDSVLG